MRLKKFMLSETLRRVDGIVSWMIAAQAGSHTRAFEFGKDKMTMTLTTDCNIYIEIIVCGILYRVLPDNGISLQEAINQTDFAENLRFLPIHHGEQRGPCVDIAAASAVLLEADTRIVSSKRNFDEIYGIKLNKRGLRIVWVCTKGEISTFLSIDFNRVEGVSNGKETRTFKPEGGMSVVVLKDWYHNQVRIKIGNVAYKINGGSVRRFENGRVLCYNRYRDPQKLELRKSNGGWRDCGMYNFNEWLMHIFDSGAIISLVGAESGGCLRIKWEFNTYEGSDIDNEQLEIKFIRCSGDIDAEDDVSESDVHYFLCNVCGLFKAGTCSISNDKSTHISMIRVHSDFANKLTYTITYGKGTLAIVYIGEQTFQMLHYHSMIYKGSRRYQDTDPDHIFPAELIGYVNHGWVTDDYDIRKLQTAAGMVSIREDVLRRLDVYLAYSPLTA
jgi:hypothetical protein